MAAAAVLLVDSKPPTNNSRYPAASGVRSPASPAARSAAHVSAYQGDDLSMDPPSPSVTAAVTSRASASAGGAAASSPHSTAPEQELHDSHIETFPRLPERVSAAAGSAAGGASRRTFPDRPKRQPVLRHAAEVVYFPRTSYHRPATIIQSATSRGDSLSKAKSHRRTSSDCATGHSFNAAAAAAAEAAAEMAAFSAAATAETAGDGAAADVAFRLRIAAGQSAPRRALTRSASFQPVDGRDSPLSSGSPDAEDSFAFHVSAPRICDAAAASGGVVLPSRISSTAETGGADTRQLSFMGARSPSRSAAAAEAAAIAPAQAASGRSGPRSPTPPTSQGVPRTPSLRLPPSPASSRRGIISPSGFHAPACPLPPPSPSASPLSSPCLSPSSFSFAVPRANSRENRAAAAVSSSASRGGDGGSGSGQRENLPRSMSSQWDVSSRSLRAGRNLSVSSPNRMLSTNLNLKAAMACVAADSATGAVDSATSATDSPRAGVSASAAMPSPTRNATAGSILRRGGPKRMPSLDSMSPVYATSSSPSSSPLSIHTTSNPPATAIPSEPLSEPASSTAEAAAEATGAGAAAASSTTGPPSPGLSPKGSPVPTPQLSPGPSPKGKHVRHVSFCTMVRVRRFSACDADLGPAADAAITAFAEAEAAAAAAAERATAAEESADAETAAAAATAAAEMAAKAAREAREARAAEDSAQAARVPPAAQHALQRGSQSFSERPHRHSRSPSNSGALHLVPEPAAQPRAIRRSSSFQSLGSGASAGQHSSYGRPGYQLGYLPSHYPSNHPTHLPSNLSPNYHSGQSYSAAGRISGMEEKRGGKKSQKLGNVGLSGDSGELELELRIPVPPRMPSPRLSPSPRVQRLLQHMG